MTDRAQLLELNEHAFREALPALLDIYVRAMGYPPGTAPARAPLWSDHARRDGFRCVAAVTDDRVIVGMGYGYLGRPGQWWYQQVQRGLAARAETADSPFLPSVLQDYFELTELHVHPDHQGAGLGEALLRALVGTVTAGHVMLSTPEGENRAWRLYRRLGFGDVLRDFLFTGDSRPFAVLAHALPLTDSAVTDPG